MKDILPYGGVFLLHCNIFSVSQTTGKLIGISLGLMKYEHPTACF